jgi:predicted metal-dependent phosphoesterase TrpH
LPSSADLQSTRLLGGRDGVAEILEAAVEAGLDGNASTDHDTLEGPSRREFVRERGLNLLVIPGVEVSTPNGTPRPGGSGISPAGRSPRRRSTSSQARGDLIVSHPYHPFRHAMYRIPACDAVEVFNSKYIFGLANILARREAARLGLPMVAGSDAHSARSVGLGVTIVSVGEEVDVMGAIRRGRVEIDGKRTPPAAFVGQMGRWAKRRLRTRTRR